MNIGDKVTCRRAAPAYYGGMFEPGTVGVVATVAPKVCKVKGPGLDGRDDFLVVDYTDETGTSRRVGLNFCNAMRIPE